MIQANVSQDDYRHCIQRTKGAIRSCVPTGTPNHEHMTFDFAQNTTILHYAREVGAHLQEK